MQEDLIELFFLMLRGFDNVNMSNYLIIGSINSTRNDGFMNIRKRFRSDEAKHYFSIEL